MAGRAKRRAIGPAIRLILPVSGAAVTLREPTGVEDVLLADCRADDPALVLDLVERLAEADDGGDWGSTPVVDIDTLILRLRRLVLGDLLSSSLDCTSVGCGSRVEISFGIESYLAHHRPGRAPLRKRGWNVGAPDGAGWFALAGHRGETARFRLPTLGDQIAVAGHPDAVSALAARCLDAASPRLRSQAEAAMAILAPPMADALHGRCPDCGGDITAWFEARAYCLRELGFRARFVYDDVDTLAERYHWSERAILTLPNARRVSYAERARQMRQA